MTFAYDPPLNSDYLFVKLLVKNESEQAFRRGMSIVKETVFKERLGWRLIRAGKRIAPRSDDADHVQYMHLWQADNPINLWQGQFTVASDSDYAELYRGVDREQQDILRIPAVYAPTKAFNERAKAFLLVQELKLAKDWSQVLDWQWTLPVPVGDNDLAPEKFTLSFAFQAVTGVLRSHFHLFESDDVTDSTTPDEPDDGERALIDLERLEKPRNPRVDIAPNVRTKNKRALRADLAVTREDVEVYKRETYENV